MNAGSNRILLVEGDAATARHLSAGIAHASDRALDVVLASSTRQAGVELLVQDFDAVLVGVPHAELGFAELGQLEERASDTPILVYGPAAPDALCERLRGRGAEDYLPRGSLSDAEVGLFVRCLGYAVQKRRLQGELREARELGRHLAHHDALTGLPNQRQFTHRLQQLIAQARRYRRQLAVLLLDLDRFKPINDTLGPERGDQLLRSVADRLTGCLRESDTVARRSADEFTIVLDGIARSQDAARVARKVLAALVEPYVLEGRELVVAGSIGISLFPADGTDVESLVRHADIAMDRAKARGGASFQFFVPEMTESAAERLDLEQDLRAAIERDELLLHYQPQVDLATERITGMEALVRWQHPTRGLIPPDRFVPLAEETGLIVPLGEWVLREACAQNRAWQAADLPRVPVAVNLSARQFQDDRPAERTDRALDRSGLDPECLDRELTESAVMTDADAAIATLCRMRDIGVGISIDDFGTGHSSLSYLKRFPIDRLKIDKGFVQSLLVDAKDEAITRAIIGMANNLELRAVAEGVETTEQLDFLRSLGCDEGQGYLYSRPLPAEEAGAFLARARAAVAPSSN